MDIITKMAVVNAIPSFFHRMCCREVSWCVVRCRDVSWRNSLRNVCWTSWSTALDWILLHLWMVDAVLPCLHTIKGKYNINFETWCLQFYKMVTHLSRSWTLPFMWTHCCSVNFRSKARTIEGASPYLTLGKPVINPSCGGRAGLFPFPIVDKPPDGVMEYVQP